MVAAALALGHTVQVTEWEHRPQRASWVDRLGEPRLGRLGLALLCWEVPGSSGDTGNRPGAWHFILVRPQHPESSDRLQLGNEGWSACGAASHGSLLGTVGHQLPSVRCPLGSSDKRLPGLGPAQPPLPGLREAAEKSQWPWAGPSLRNQVAEPAVTRATSDTSALLSERTPALCLCAHVLTHMRYSSMCTHVQAAFPRPAQCHVHGGGSAHMCTRFSVVH